MTSINKILVFGATSAICHETLKLFANTGAEFYLVARNNDKLAAIGDDLRARGGKIVDACSYNFSNSLHLTSRQEEVIEDATVKLGSIDLILVAHGSLPEQSTCEASNTATLACINDNFTSTALIINSAAELLRQQGRGTLAVISSVAGDRGRKSNYLYGATKAGIDTLLEGLRGRFFGSEVKVVNIKPGMIDTPMTSHLAKSAIWATPQGIAPAIHSAIIKGRAVSYVPSFWRLIMLVIRLLPASILARLPI